MRKKTILFVFVILMTMLCMNGYSQDANEKVIKTGDNGGVKLDTKNNDIAMTVFAIGKGICDLDEVESKTEAKLNAERAAMADGYRQLAEIVNGLKLTAKTTVENYVTQNDTVKTEVNAFVKNARKVETKYSEDDGQIIAEVKMEAPISSAGFFSNKILPWVEQQIIDETKNNVAPPPSDDLTPVLIASKPKPKANKTVDIDDIDLKSKSDSLSTDDSSKQAKSDSTPEPAATHKDKEPVSEPTPDKSKEPAKPIESDNITIVITGVIFDTKGKEYKEPMLPEVRNEDNKIVFNLAIAKEMKLTGMFYPYAFSNDEAVADKRVKTIPLEIKAVKIVDDIVIISNEDADKLLSINKEAKILSKGKVLFLVDNK